MDVPAVDDPQYFPKVPTMIINNSRRVLRDQIWHYIKKRFQIMFTQMTSFDKYGDEIDDIPLAQMAVAAAQLPIK